MCKDPPTGVWHITPSNQFRSSGPSKQFLTSHVLPSTHYAGAELMADFAEGEPWKKVLGPIFIYVNSIPRGEVKIGTLYGRMLKDGFFFVSLVEFHLKPIDIFDSLVVLFDNRVII